MRKSIYQAEQRRLLQLLREIRQEAGLTQQQVAYQLREHQSFVSKYESGERRLDLIELKEVCRVLEITLREFVAKFEGRG